MSAKRLNNWQTQPITFSPLLYTECSTLSTNTTCIRALAVDVGLYTISMFKWPYWRFITHDQHVLSEQADSTLTPHIVAPVDPLHTCGTNGVFRFGNHSASLQCLASRLGVFITVSTSAYFLSTIVSQEKWIATTDSTGIPEEIPSCLTMSNTRTQ